MGKCWGIRKLPQTTWLSMPLQVRKLVARLLEHAAQGGIGPGMPKASSMRPSPLVVGDEAATASSAPHGQQGTRPQEVVGHPEAGAGVGSQCTRLKHGAEFPLLLLAFC